MTIVYRDGPYAGQDDYLMPLPHRLRGVGDEGYYQRTSSVDADGRVVFQWIRDEEAESDGVAVG